MQPPKSISHKFTALFCLLLFSSAIQAQRSIHFEDISFDEAVAKAKARKKIVFVDVRGINPNSYTDKVEKEVFTSDSVADFFNTHCISIRINMGSEEGKKFAPRLAMLMYPVYVFHGRNGDQLDFTNAGSILKDPAVLMQKVRSSLETDRVKNANTRAITFTKDSWKNILQKAKTAGKLVFLDAQTTWCRPCILMARDIFTLNRVADFYNEHFINVTMDMEKGEGPSLVKKYDIHAYPTFLYIDGNGKLVHRDGGYQEADTFLLNGRTAISKMSDISLTLSSSDTAIRFTEDTWSSLLSQAKHDGKLIFVDANTSWCGPCKQMRREIFTQKKVGRLYNSNFINVDLDMEKGEGIEFRKKYAVRAYPTFLYIDGDGKVVHKTVGSCSEEEFRQHALDALSPRRSLLSLSTGYKDHKNDETLVTAYLSALGDAYETKLADSIATVYLKNQTPSSWQQPGNWQLINKYVNDATAPPFLAVVNEQDAYSKLFGTEEVEKKIYQTYMTWPQSFLLYPEKGKARVDQDAFDAFLRQVNSGPYAKKAEIAARAKLTIYFGVKEWHNYAGTVDEMLSNHIVPMDPRGAEWLYSFADIINRFAGDDKQTLTSATQWAKLGSTDIQGVNASDKATYLDLYAALLEKTGQTDQALQIRKDINQQQLTNAKQSAPFQTLIRIVPKQN
ncbi:MAG: thioredoxin family protein [Chitinophagaceae bacterium]|nr:thioredoxin family protein [Chitinophagaceae bacterium]